MLSFAATIVEVLAVGAALGAFVAFVRIRRERGWYALAGVGLVAGFATSTQLDHAGTLGPAGFAVGGVVGWLLATRALEADAVPRGDASVD